MAKRRKNSNLSKDQIAAIVLLISLVFMFVPIPFLSGRTIAALGILGVVIYLFLFWINEWK